MDKKHLVGQKKLEEAGIQVGSVLAVSQQTREGVEVIWANKVKASINLRGYQQKNLSVGCQANSKSHGNTNNKQAVFVKAEKEVM